MVNGIDCVHCHSAQVQKVSAVCRQGTWSGSSVGVGVGYGRTSNGQSMSVVDTSVSTFSGATDISRLLAPPQMPCRDQSEILGIIVCSFAGLLCLAGTVAMLVNDPQSHDTGTYVIAGLAGVATLFFTQCVVRYAINTSQSNRNWKAQSAGMIHRFNECVGNWNRLYYCQRCDVVYTPGNTQCTSSNMLQAQMASYIAGVPDQRRLGNPRLL